MNRNTEYLWDGYGLYQYSNNGLILTGVSGNQDRISYAIKEGTVCIQKYAFKNMTHLEIITIPSSLKEIEEEAFIHGNRNIYFDIAEDNPFFTFQDHMLIDKRDKKLLFYTGNEKTVRIPETVECIASEAFRACPSEVIVFHDHMKEIHPDALTGCRLKKAVFTSKEAELYFPYRDIRMRQYMLEGFGKNHQIFDFARYDEALLSGFMEADRIREISARLLYPYHLSKENEERFREILEDNLVYAVMASGEDNDAETIIRLTKCHVIHEENIDMVLETLHSLQDLECYAVMLDYKNTNMKKQAFDFTL